MKLHAKRIVMGEVRSIVDRAIANAENLRERDWSEPRAAANPYGHQRVGV
jgi:hypothetical protein